MGGEGLPDAGRDHIYILYRYHEGNDHLSNRHFDVEQAQGFHPSPYELYIYKVYRIYKLYNYITYNISLVCIYILYVIQT